MAFESNNFSIAIKHTRNLLFSHSKLQLNCYNFKYDNQTLQLRVENVK